MIQKDCLKERFRIIEKEILQPLGIKPGTTRYKEMRNSFYTGMFCMFTLLDSVNIVCDSEDSEMHERQIAAYVKELNEFKFMLIQEEIFNNTKGWSHD